MQVFLYLFYIFNLCSLHMYSRNNFFLIFQVFLTAGLGGMSGAQAKAAVIAGCIGVVAEVKHIHV